MNKENTVYFKKFSLALALSGCAALIYQVAWQRVLSQLIGSDSISTTVIITIFMLSLTIGAEFAKYILSKFTHCILIIYVIIEVAIGFYGIFSIQLLRAINANLSDRLGASILFDFILNFLLLSPPVIGMGLVVPLIVHVAKQKLNTIGRIAGTLYSWNIFGAALGSILAGLVLIEIFGLIGTTRIAAMFNLFAGWLIWRVLKRLNKTKEKNNTSNPPIMLNTSFSNIMACILFGFGTLSLQIIFFRVLTNYFTASTIVFPILLCSYLCLMSLGNWLGGHLADKYQQKLLTVITTLFCIGVFLLLLAFRFPPDFAAALHVLRFTSFNGQLIESKNPELLGDPTFFSMVFFMIFLMLSVIPWSGLFPVMFRLITKHVDEAGSRFAHLYMLYTTGNIVGIFITGIVLFPTLGTGHSVIVVAVVVALGCLSLFISKNSCPNEKRKAGVALALGLMLTLGVPTDYYRQFFNYGDYLISDVFEGRTGVVSVVPTHRFYTIIDMNRTACASAINTNPGPQDQYEAYRWNHTDLMALDPDFRPKQILVIGLGHAYLIDSMLDLPFVEKITVVELSSEVIDAVKKYSLTSTRRIFTDPRVEIIIGDGRHFVQIANKRGIKYDLIQNKINEPWHAGMANLFTREFFEEEKILLSPGGYLSTRPLIGHLSDGFSVFGNAIYANYYHMYFKNGHVNQTKTAIVSKDIKNAWFNKLPGDTYPIMNEINNENSRKILSVIYFNSVPKELTTDPNTDDRLTFEYYRLREFFGDLVSPRTSLLDMDTSKYEKKIPVILADNGSAN